MEMRRGSNTAGIVNERNIIVNISGIRSSREEEDDDDEVEEFFVPLRARRNNNNKNTGNTDNSTSLQTKRN